MRIEDLEKALQEIRAIFAASGDKKSEADLTLLVDYIHRQANRDLPDVLREIREKLDPKAAHRIAVAQHVSDLREAGLDEAKFRPALADLKTDKAMDKKDVLEIATEYGVIRITGKSRDSYIDSIEKHFYWALYNRDADAMAKRATPW